ncbi:MAG: hypothetical protein IT536_07165 [Hyphomicrobiales bacterium]|nr:hypothetical protein [Hyphomicrobiales bacterium]
MAEPILHKYFDFGDRALANVTLRSRERVLLTILPAGFAVHRLHVFGIIPGSCLFGANTPAYTQMANVLVRDALQLPPLPRARGQHQDRSASYVMPTPPNAPMLDDPSVRPLSLFTRLALSVPDAEELVRRLERSRNIVA